MATERSIQLRGGLAGHTNGISSITQTGEFINPEIYTVDEVLPCVELNVFCLKVVNPPEFFVVSAVA